MEDAFLSWKKLLRSHCKCYVRY